MQIAVTDAMIMAPSWKACKIADPSFTGFGKDSRGRGLPPTSCVVVAFAADGSRYQHFHFFGRGADKAREIRDAVEERGWIDGRHWRKCAPKEY
jgi:hypothetical protein